jgi:hypothetical protein
MNQLSWFDRAVLCDAGFKASRRRDVRTGAGCLGSFNPESGASVNP